MGDIVKRVASVTGESGVVVDVRTFATVGSEKTKFLSNYVDTKRLKYIHSSPRAHS